MDIKTLNDLFDQELQNTYLAEKLLISLLSKPSALGAAQAAIVEAGLGRAQERVQRLDPIVALTKSAPGAAKPLAAAAIPAGLQSVIAAIEKGEAGEAAKLAALRTFRHYLLASYAKLSLWADQLSKPELAKILSATLAEEKAAALMPSNVSEGGRADEPKSISLGERLTAMFDRKR
jgi:ferritin-like metal-binding protein YciE